ncbi:hypothetical protein DY000_02024985 [Brassica cretica]|uniref:Uncharacterized protein n=1 Tax=Brassica cretica TaxID=69181 RepID=A0ABQ7E4I4_BRACR|nr:hypothetical protein DY000_02024985 [Brassica cretica]
MKFRWFSPSLSLTSSADLVADSPFRLSGVLVRGFKDVYSKRSPILSLKGDCSKVYLLDPGVLSVMKSSCVSFLFYCLNALTYVCLVSYSSSAASSWSKRSILVRAGLDRGANGDIDPDPIRCPPIS